MTVERLDATNARDLKRFVRLEPELMRDQPFFWAETEADVRKRLSGKSALSEDLELQLFTANGSARCAAIVNPRWQEEDRAGRDAGSIGWFASARDAGDEVIEMLGEAEGWLAEHGVRRVLAPFNGNAFLGMGVLTDAFDEDPMFPMPWHPPWYAQQLEMAGYVKAYPLYVYEIDLRSDDYRATVERGLRNGAARIRHVDKKRWREELNTLRELLNEGFADEWEFQRFEREEFEEMFAPMKSVINSRLIQFAELDGSSVGFVMGFPDWTPLFRSFRGRLGPIQLFRMLRGSRRTAERIGLLSIALLPEARGKRIGQALAAGFYRASEELGYDKAVYYVVNESNTASRALAMSFGARERLLYHCYDKRLD
jgi:GNAT superfamily N-acetyltransferase